MAPDEFSCVSVCAARFMRPAIQCHKERYLTIRGAGIRLLESLFATRSQKEEQGCQ
jgi:hypothetical protein